MSFVSQKDSLQGDETRAHRIPIDRQCYNFHTFSESRISGAHSSALSMERNKYSTRKSHAELHNSFGR